MCGRTASRRPCYHAASDVHGIKTTVLFASASVIISRLRVCDCERSVGKNGKSAKTDVGTGVNVKKERTVDALGLTAEIFSGRK